MKKGGTARSLRTLFIWAILVSILLGITMYSEFSKKQKNYKFLWEKVNRLEVEHGF